MADREDDFLSEIAGEMRREGRTRVLRWWALGFVAMGVVAVGAVGVTSLWRTHQREAVHAASLALERARSGQDLADLAALAGEETGYSTLARAHWARALADAGRMEEAVGIWDTLAGDIRAPASLRAAARVQAARAVAGYGTADMVEARVGDLASGESPWRHLAREAVAMAAWRGGELERSRDIVRRARADEGLTPIMRVRYDRLAGLLALDDDADDADTDNPS